ncbi:alpha/beta fold hydrolase [Streptomyces olivochromogenes]|uniref:Alpha/beta hydrolase n=1 Tax=Streptomyces olivochromogenes TaxID=1963 RepID=A0A250VWT0_STROL|nr:alpha/beta hydrolase [Streptomyces olivochromogenes]KUN34031.1 alpha/beta hydrolase [Streptomyces olivochromogenes]GAX58472.1 alpha/beta hydrolase [Streptomyces olivochromogenes]
MADHTHDTAPTQFVEAGGIRFAYRRFGDAATDRTPVVFFQHFIGNLDDHDPAISDGFAADREVILFNNTGVASTSGVVPDTIEQMATDAGTFIDALGLSRVDLVGHSMGGLVAQQVALQRPDLSRKLVLVGTGPRGGVGIGETPAETAALFTVKLPRQEDMWLPVLFAPTGTSQRLGRAYVERIVARKDRDASPFGEQVYAGQGTAIHTYGTTKDPAYSVLKNITIPVLVVNGTDDIIIPTINSYILQQFLPDAELIIYPDANHGAHFQYPDRFVTHTKLFLDR